MKYGAADFLSDSPPPRVMGAEMEYYVQKPDEVEALTLYVAGATELGWPTSYDIHGFLPNGARIWPDLGHIEYSTQECLSAEEVVLAEHAGRAIVRKLVDASGILHKGILDRAVSVNYKKLDAPETTNGFHENYAIPVDKEVINRIHQYMPTFIATRAIWSGSGYISPKGFKISQKAEDIGSEFLQAQNDRALPGRKPMIYLTSDAGTPQLQRCEIRAMDPTRSWFARKMGFNATSLFLRIMELGNPDMLASLPRLANPVNTLKLISRDMSLSDTYQLDDGTTATAAQIQLRYAEAAMALTKIAHLPREEEDAARDWYWLCEELDAVNSSDLLDVFKDRLDWVARAATIRDKLGPKALEEFSFSAAHLDVTWDRIDVFTTKRTQRSVSDIGRRAFAHLLTSEMRSRAQHLEGNAPTTTRASLRSYAYRCESSPLLSKMDWGSVKFTDDKERSRHYQFDPYDVHDPEHPIEFKAA